MPATEHDEAQLGKLETQVDDLLKQLDDVIKLHAAPGAPHADDEGMTGSGKHNLSGHKRKSSKHDQQPKNTGDLGKVLEEMEALVAKAKEVDGADDGDEADMGKMLEKFEKILLKAKKKSAAADEEDAADGGADEEEEFDSPSDSSKKSLEDDETVVIEGQRIAKSEVGDAQFAILKGMDDRLQKAQQEIQKAKDETELERLRKIADDQYGHIPGTLEERAQMLKTISGLPEKMKKSFEKVLATADKLAKSGFDRVGVNGGVADDVRKASVTFEAKVGEIKKRDNCSQTDAMAKARKEDPEGFKAYQGQN